MSAWLRALWARIVAWVNEPLADDGVPQRCPGCGDRRPPDRLLWERWELEHEEHPEFAW